MADGESRYHGICANASAKRHKKVGWATIEKRLREGVGYRDDKRNKYGRQRGYKYTKGKCQECYKEWLRVHRSQNAQPPPPPDSTYSGSGPRRVHSPQIQTSKKQPRHSTYSTPGQYLSQTVGSNLESSPTQNDKASSEYSQIGIEHLGRALPDASQLKPDTSQARAVSDGIWQEDLPPSQTIFEQIAGIFSTARRNSLEPMDEESALKREYLHQTDEIRMLEQAIAAQGNVLLAVQDRIAVLEDKVKRDAPAPGMFDLEWGSYTGDTSRSGLYIQDSQDAVVYRVSGSVDEYVAPQDLLKPQEALDFSSAHGDDNNDTFMHEI